MGAHHFNSGGMIGIIHLADIFCYGGFTFEWHDYLGPVKCRKDGEPSNAKSGKKFYAAVMKWYAFPESKREKYRIYG
jgi:hypothetical protein